MSQIRVAGVTVLYKAGAMDSVFWRAPEGHNDQ